MSARSHGAVAGALVLRPAMPEDVPAMHAIELTSFSDPWSETSFRALLAQPQVMATVADRAGRVVGYSIAWILGDEAELANLAVAMDARGGGIGRTLVDSLIAAIAERGGATIYLEVRESNVAALALYRRHGFVAAGRRKAYYRAPAEDAVVMRRAWAADGRPD